MQCGNLSTIITKGHYNECYANKTYPILLLQIAVMIFGICGNVLVLIVYISKKNATIANYFMLYLAVLDLSSCIVVHPYIMHRLEYTINTDQTTCKIFGFLRQLLNDGQAFVYLAIAIDRFYAVCRPLRFAHAYEKAIRNAIKSFLMCLLYGFPLLVVYGNSTVLVVEDDVTQQHLYGYVCTYYVLVKDQAVTNSLNLVVIASLFISLFATAIIYLIIGIEAVKQKSRVSPDLPLQQTGCGEVQQDNTDNTTRKTSLLKQRKPSPVCIEYNPNVNCVNPVVRSLPVNPQNGDCVPESNNPASSNMPDIVLNTPSCQQTRGSKPKLHRTDHLTYDEHSEEIIENSPNEYSIGQCHEHVIHTPMFYISDQDTDVSMSDIMTSSREASFVSAKCTEPGFVITEHNTEACNDVTDTCHEGMSRARSQSNFKKTVTFEEESSHAVAKTEPEVQPVEGPRGSTGSITTKTKKISGYKEAKTFLAITVIFFLSNVPSWILPISIGPRSRESFLSYTETLVVLLQNLFVLNNIVKPVVYYVINSNFKSDVRNLCRKKPTRIVRRRKKKSSG